MKSEVYIGKNGVGKSKYLKQLKVKDSNSLLISFSNNWDAPDEFQKNFAKTNAFKGYKKFVEKIFSVPIEVKDDCKAKIEKKKKEFNFSELNNSFSDLENDYYLKGLVTAENLKKFIKERGEEEIKHSLLSFGDKLKIDKDYGTGKFVYFMIKFMYICLKNLPTNNSGKKYTLIIDEPEVFLHTGLIREVAFNLRKINEKINVIVATHSVDFLQYFCTNETNIHFLEVKFEKTTPKTLEEGKFLISNLNE